MLLLWRCSPSARAVTVRASSSVGQQIVNRKMTQGELVQAALRIAPVPLVDIGVNIGDPSFDKDRDEVIERARQANVGCMIVTGTCEKTIRRAEQICEASTSYPLYYTAGVHPHNAKECTPETLESLRKHAANPKCVAIGECGLDFNRNFSPPDVQIEWFDKQVQLAVELKKPLFMHCRDAADKFAEILRKYAPLPAPSVIHCFTGNATELQTFLDLGLYIGVTGWICDERPDRGGAELAALLPSIPKDRLMIETDAPYLVPRTIKPNKARPGRNEPALLTHVLLQAAEAMGEDPAVVGSRTSETAKTVFGIQL